MLEKLGNGTYGVVYKANHRTSDQKVAIKKLKLHVNIIFLLTNFIIIIILN